MLGRSHQLQGECFIRARYDTNSTPHTVLIDDTRLELLGTGDLLHLYGVKLTPVDTGLTTAAKLLVHGSPVPAGRKNFVNLTLPPVEQRIYYHTAVIAAIAEKVTMGGVQGYVDQSAVFTVVNYRQGFFKGYISGWFDELV